MTRGAGAAAAIGAAAAGVLAWALAVEPRRIVVRRSTLRLPHWPRELAGLRVAVVSDLHAGGPHVKADAVARVVEKVNAQRPDLVLLLGDYVDDGVALGGRVEPETVARLLGGLRARLGAFAVLGNHDWMEGGRRVAQALRRAGVAVLEDDAAPVDGPLWVVGLDAPGDRPLDVPGAFAGAPESAVVIVLSHSPDAFPRVPDRAALTVAGHTHGGQVNLPLLRRHRVPSRYGDRYAAGHVVEAGRHLFVTAGIGTSTLPVRLRRPPEVAVLTLEPLG